MNPILLEIFKNRFASIAEEMGMALKRTAFSPNIKERRDFSCALFDARGRMVAQAAHIPVHLGSMPLSVKAAIDAHYFREGDMVIINDPFAGGTHLPDITMVAPVFIEGKGPLFYVANRAHHADVGGMSAGSMPTSTSIFQEGIIIPPTLFVENNRMNAALMRLILANVRTPAEREGDFSAQMTANITGIRRLHEVVAAHGIQTVQEYAGHLIDYAEAVTRRRIAAIPDGTYEFEDIMEDDGQGAENIRIHARLMIRGDSAEVDFTGSDDQVAGCVNTVHAVTLSSVLYVFRSLIADDIPTNAGCMAPITVVTRKGSLLDAALPAAVAAGNVETSQRIVDVLLGALSAAIPEDIPAAAQGTMNNVTIGGIHPDTGLPFTYYETIGGGMGAATGVNGASAVQSHMTNTMNTPVEALEFSFPLLVTEYGIRRGSGGSGRYRGGNGIFREIRLLGDAEVTVLSERRRTRPYGLAGGSPGKAGRNAVFRGDRVIESPAKFRMPLRKDDRLRIETPGGGGYGKPKD